MLQDASTVSELIRENQQAGIKLPHSPTHTQIRVNLGEEVVLKLTKGLESTFCTVYLDNGFI